MAADTPDTLTVKCPKCRASIRLTDAIVGPLLEQEQQRHNKAIDELRAALVKKANEFAEKKAAEAIAAADKRVKDVDQILAAQDLKLTEARNEQAKTVQLQTALAAEKADMELTIARRVQSEAETQRQAAQKIADEAAALKIADKDTQIAGMLAQIDDLKRRAEQGSQQTQGETQEMVLESLLHSTFPIDTIEPVGKGQFGGDCLQRVLGPSGQQLGSILWESKRTKNWTAGWLAKLRSDQRAAKAEVAVIASQALPDGVNGFGLVDGVWVCRFEYAIPMAVCLRQGLIDLAAIRQSAAGQETKAGIMYAYLTGPQFRNRVGAVVEKMQEMQRDLAAERTAITRLWAKREGQIQGAGLALAGFYGDLQGICGVEVAELAGMTLPELAEGKTA